MHLITPGEIDHATSAYRLNSKPSDELLRLALHFERVAPQATHEANRRDTLAIAVACRKVVADRMMSPARWARIAA